MGRLHKSSASRTPLGVAALAVASLLGRTAAADIVTSSAGLRVNWERVGYPASAAKIAACSANQIYALNADKTLWVSNAGGADGTWQYLDKPTLADSIGCDGKFLVAMNYDKTVYRMGLTSTGGFYGWFYIGHAPGANTIGGGAGVITALNFDHNVYTSQGDDSTTFPGQDGSWSWRDTATYAARIAGSFTPDGAGRLFALNTDNRMWYSDQTGNWNAFPVGLPSGTNPIEISAASKTVLFALDSTKHLWSATMGDTTVQSTDGTGRIVYWSPIGYPAGGPGLHTAAKIAACSVSDIYVLNTDKTLYVTHTRGLDGVWYYMDTPSLADSIACDGTTLVAMNYDKTVYRMGLTSTGSFYGWYYIGYAPGADTLGGGPGVVAAHNFDKYVYTSQGNDVSTFPGQDGSWRYLYHGYTPAALRVSATIGSYQLSRFFALNNDQTLWYTDGLVEGDLEWSQWNPYPLGLPPAVVPVEISAGSTNTLFVLDNNGLLWEGLTQGLDVPMMAQQESLWCWAATSAMIAEFVAGLQLDQCQLANLSTGNTQCCVNSLMAMQTQYCNQTGSWNNTLANNGFTFATTPKGTALPFTTLSYETNTARRPVAYSYNWTGGGSHAMVLIGAFVSSVSGSSQQWVTVNNPEPVGQGSRYDQLYSDWVSGTGYSHYTDTYQIVKH
jgi:hypothetical protein